MNSTLEGGSGQPAGFNKRHVLIIILTGCLIALLASGPRSTMGIFTRPMTEANAWSLGWFSLAMAIQNLMWGFGQPVAGMIADKFGTARVLTVGSAIYAAGLLLMASTKDVYTLQFTAGVIVGFGISGTAFFLVLAAYARLLPEHQRPMAFGLGTAAGSAGQFLFAPIGQALVVSYGYQFALTSMAVLVALVPLLAIILRGKPQAAAASSAPEQTILQALSEAFAHPSYRWLVAGFFVCGFHVAFITVHLPKYIHDICGNDEWGSWAISLIGLANIAGAILSGHLMTKYPKRLILSTIYFGRAIAIIAFIVFPVTLTSIMIFATAMGFLWLSTIPPTSGLVALMFGPRYMATLFGFVFISHQVGSFLGIWLGGEIYDRTGSYDMIWWIGIGLGLFAALAHLPIREQPVERQGLANA